MVQKLTPADLAYAAYNRCECGAGLAHLIDVTKNSQYWDCSAILTGEADPKVKHTAQLPFAFYDIKMEGQPSAYGATTRPEGSPPPRPRTPGVFEPLEDKVKVLIEMLFQVSPDTHPGTVDGRPVRFLVSESRLHKPDIDGDHCPPLATWWKYDDTGQVQYVVSDVPPSVGIDFDGKRFMIDCPFTDPRFDRTKKS